MKETFSDYIDNSVNRLITDLSAETISFEEKKKIIDGFTNTLIVHIGIPDLLEDSDLVISRESVLFIDSKISKVLSTTISTQQDFQDAISLCNRQTDLLNLFSEKKWEWPDLENKNLNLCVKDIEFKYDSQYVQTKIVSLDGTITSEISIAERTLSIDICDSVLKKIIKLDETINYCKEKVIKIPEINNSDIKKCKYKIELIRHHAEEKAALYENMYEVDANLKRIDALPITVEQDWIEAISLCEQQNKNKLQCKKNHWTIPVLCYTDTVLFAKKYNKYLNIVEIDRHISEKKDAASLSQEAFKQFSELCDTQAANLIVCLEHRWNIPDLENADPINLCEIVRKKKEQKDKVKNRKRNIILIFVGISIIAGLSLFGYLKYIEGKIAFPSNPTSVLGVNCQDFENELTKLGFKNIKKTPVNTGIEKGNQIISVLIDGSDFYWQGKHYYPETIVEIVYTSSDRINATEILSNWASMTYNDLLTKLRKIGFTNIKTSKTVTYEKNKDSLVSSIKINEIDYRMGSCFAPKDASINITYYDFQIRISENYSSFRGQEYNDIQNQLATEGFTKISSKSVETGLGKGGTVVGISIDGREDFRKNDVFATDVPVILYYYSFDRIDLSQILINWNEKKIENCIKELKNAGFTNIKTSKTPTYEKNKDFLVSSIKINDIDYRMGSCFAPEDASINITYYDFQIKVSNNSISFLEQDCNNVQKQLVSEGFTKISTQAITTGLGKDGTVAGISIDGQENFRRNDVFSKDATVIIYYYSTDRVDLSDILKNWNSKICENLQNELRNVGFTDITIVPRKTNSTSKYGKIYGLSLNRTEYKNGNCFIPKGSKIVLECYKVMIAIGKDASAMHKKDYKQIVSDLKQKGFTNIRLERSDDLVTGWINYPGTIKSININGSIDFKSNAEFELDANIVIVVNTFKGKDYPDIIYKAK